MSQNGVFVSYAFRSVTQRISIPVRTEGLAARFLADQERAALHARTVITRRPFRQCGGGAKAWRVRRPLTRLSRLEQGQAPSDGFCIGVRSLYASRRPCSGKGYTAHRKGGVGQREQRGPEAEHAEDLNPRGSSAYV